jgi:hypothetical protein
MVGLRSCVLSSPHWKLRPLARNFIVKVGAQTQVSNVIVVTKTGLRLDGSQVSLCMGC